MESKANTRITATSDRGRVETICGIGSLGVAAVAIASGPLRPLLLFWEGSEANA